MKEFMSFVITNWAFIVGFIFVIIMAVQKIMEFVALPTDKRMAEVKERLLEWVRIAEADLGSGTGVLKLAQVYNTFCEAFPYLKKWITIDKFDVLVKEALAKIEAALTTEQAKINAFHLSK